MNLGLENQNVLSILAHPIESQTPESGNNGVSTDESNGKDLRNSLNLRDRLEVIRLATTENYSSRRLAELFKCGRTQILSTLREKSKYLEVAKIPGSIQRKRLTPKLRFGAVNERVEQWLNEAREQEIVVTGPILQLKAREIAAELGFDHFQASNGWLESFRKRHGLFSQGQNSTVADNDNDEFDLMSGYSGDNFDLKDEHFVEFDEYDDEQLQNNVDVAVPEVILQEDELDWKHAPSSSSTASVSQPTIVLETFHVISLRKAIRHLEDLKTLAETLEDPNMLQAFTTQETVIKNLMISGLENRSQLKNENFSSPNFLNQVNLKF